MTVARDTTAVLARIRELTESESDLLLDPAMDPRALDAVGSERAQLLAQLGSSVAEEHAGAVFELRRLFQANEAMAIRRREQVRTAIGQVAGTAARIGAYAPTSNGAVRPTLEMQG